MLIVLLLFSVSVQLTSQKNDESSEDYKLIIFSESCYDQFFGETELSNECISDTISRTISILMIAFAILNQLPQILKIFKSQLIQGISFNAYYTELYLFSFITAYNIYKGTKFILYGENVIVGLEYCVVLSLFLFYDKDLNFHQWLFKAVFFITINTPLFVGLGPQWIFDMTIYINMSLLFMARFLQIRLNCRNRNTGQLSLLTQLQNYAGSIARLYTLFNDDADFSYMKTILWVQYCQFKFIILGEQRGKRIRIVMIKVQNSHVKKQNMIKFEKQFIHLQYSQFKMQCEILDWKGYLVQASLGLFSFTVLIIKRYFERPKRVWKIFMMDSSKQLLSALLAHILNVILAMELSSETDKNACIWYFITFMLDSTMGILLIFLLMKSLNMIFTYFDMRKLQSGNYFKIQENVRIDGQIYACQLFVWNSVVIVSKFILYGFQELVADQLNEIGTYLLSPINNPDLLLVFVMIIIPFIMNAITFWIQDNIIMKTEFSNQEEKQLLIGTFYEGTLTEDFIQELVVL
ncbi:unnamed protein product [Paramecium pentaurelia]|uniref:Transmembrane protein n=1 Tax=Paramecium pentaurelia TaxID=43138 RepID=A0A8S1T5Y4_9CILI|nr:unnamed protein product [Paramecium pentaurelia]